MSEKKENGQIRVCHVTIYFSIQHVQLLSSSTHTAFQSCLSALIPTTLSEIAVYKYNERVETPTAPNSNSSSAEAIFDQKIPSHSFQTEQQVRGRFEESSRIVRSKIHPNGPELAFEQKRVTKHFKPSECVATKSCAEGNLLFPSLFPIGHN